MECHRRRNKRVVDALKDKRGQATVEFAIIMSGFLAITIALGALWHLLNSGLIINHALAVASHHVQTVAPVTVVDIFLY